MPIANHQLTLDQLDHIRKLAQRCRHYDGNTIPIYSNVLLQNRSLPCNLLYYRRQQLVGFLSVFFFYDDACELTLMVDPALRRQHIASTLLSIIMPIIHSREVARILCASPQGLNDAWLPTRGLLYQNSECQMQWKRKFAITHHHATLTISKVTNDDDIQTLVHLDNTCFHTEKHEMETRFHQLLRDDTYTLFILHQDKQAIGKAHLHQEPDAIQLSDIAILPSHQGHGLGQALVAHCIHDAKKMRSLPLRLDVESSNHNALHIYHKLGFKIINAWDFWMADPHNLKETEPRP